MASRLPGARRPSTPSSSHRLDVPVSRPQAEHLDETIWASKGPVSPIRTARVLRRKHTSMGRVKRNIPSLSSQDRRRKETYEPALTTPKLQRVQTAPAPRPKYTAMDLLQRNIPSLSSKDHRSKKKYVNDPHLAQGQLGQGEDSQVGIRIKPDTADHGESQSVFSIKELPDDANDEVDYRFIRPTTRYEIRQVREALLATRLGFRKETGCEAPETPEDECYARQHRIIQNGIWEVWLLVDKEPPLLYSIDSWTGGFDNWHGLKTSPNGANALFAEFQRLLPLLPRELASDLGGVA